MRWLNRFMLSASVSAAVLVAGCASTSSPEQLAVAYRQIFNGALQTIHQLHEQGKLSVPVERELLPAILAGSAALDQMDSDAASGNQAGFDVAAAAAQAALSQLQAAAHPATQPSTAPAAAPAAGASASTTPMQSSGG